MLVVPVLNHTISVQINSLIYFDLKKKIKIVTVSIKTLYFFLSFLIKKSFILKYIPKWVFSGAILSQGMKSEPFPSTSISTFPTAVLWILLPHAPPVPTHSSRLDFCSACRVSVVRKRKLKWNCNTSHTLDQKCPVNRWKTENRSASQWSSSFSATKPPQLSTASRR